MDIVEVAAVPVNGNTVTDMVAQGNTMMQTRSSYATAVAVQRPRKLSDVKRRLEEEADLAGETFYYGWGAGGERIEGPSVELALATARCWGNSAVELMPVQETVDSWVFTACFIDLETGFTLSRQFRQSKKWKVHGKMDDERKADVRFQIGQSKAIRNVVLNAVPKSLVNVAMEKAKAGVKQKIEQYVSKNGLPAAVDMVLKALAKVGVKEDRVLHKFNIKDKKALTVDDVVLLRGDLSAIETGKEWADALFPQPSTADDLNEALKAKTAEPEAEVVSE